LNYRHAFHAGNFADLVKHAGLLRLLARLTSDAAPLSVIDTHAGRGLYDLAGSEAKKSGEAAQGIARLMAEREAPPEFDQLRAFVAGLNLKGEARRYPGSPWLAARALRPQDSYLGCELRPAEHTALKAALQGIRNAQTLCMDGYQAAVVRAPKQGRLFALIDPPFERPDDYAQVVRTAAALDRRRDETRTLIWLPLKDLATFDAFLGDLEDAVRRPVLVAETRIRPLSDPMKMNGCALVLIDPPQGLEPELTAICGWTADELGEAGEARVYRL
jgi:23S rRNA (adenine2030-N6)-methyltransferase